MADTRETVTGEAGVAGTAVPNCLIRALGVGRTGVGASGALVFQRWHLAHDVGVGVAAGGVDASSVTFTTSYSAGATSLVSFAAATAASAAAFLVAAAAARSLAINSSAMRDLASFLASTIRFARRMSTACIAETLA